MFVFVCFSDVFDVYLKKGVCVAVKCRQMHMDWGGGGGGGGRGEREHGRSMQEKD